MATVGLEERIARLEAVREIENLMSRYAFYHAACTHEKCLQISALETPGVSVELPFGVYEGRAGLQRRLIAASSGRAWRRDRGWA